MEGSVNAEGRLVAVPGFTCRQLADLRPVLPHGALRDPKTPHIDEIFLDSRFIFGRERLNGI